MKGTKSREVRVHAVSWLGMFTGLMFSSGKKALLFRFYSSGKRALHSWFVFFPFLAVWLDETNKVLAWKRVLPFSLHVLPRQPFHSLLEIPYTFKHKRLVDFIVGKSKIPTEEQRFKYECA